MSNDNIELAPDHPLVQSWKAYQSTDAYRNATFDDRLWLDNALFAAFEQGWRAAKVHSHLLDAVDRETPFAFASNVPASSAPFDFRCTCGHWKRNHNDTGCTVGMVGPIEQTCQCQKFECRDLCSFPGIDEMSGDENRS